MKTLLTGLWFKVQGLAKHVFFFSKIVLRKIVHVSLQWSSLWPHIFAPMSKCPLSHEPSPKLINEIKQHFASTRKIYEMFRLDDF